MSDDAPDIDAPSAGWGGAIALADEAAERCARSAARWTEQVAAWRSEGRPDLVSAFAGSVVDAANEAEGSAAHAGLVRAGLVPFDLLDPSGEAARWKTT